MQAHAADIEVFFKTVRLEQIGKFECADIAAAFANFPLEIEDYAAQFFQREALAQ